MTYLTTVLTDAQIATIDNATSGQDALSRTGEMGDSYHIRRAYIAQKRFGGRSVNRLNSRGEVTARFIEVWNER